MPITQPYFLLQPFYKRKKKNLLLKSGKDFTCICMCRNYPFLCLVIYICLSSCKGFVVYNAYRAMSGKH
jgi:hypothetical protein